MPSCPPHVKDILRQCVTVACQKVEDAGLVPFVEWRWLHQGSVYIDVRVAAWVGSPHFNRIGAKIRISDHGPGVNHDASWSIHPGSDNDIDRLVARARRMHQAKRNEARSRAAANREHCDRIHRKSFKRGRR